MVSFAHYSIQIKHWIQAIALQEHLLTNHTAILNTAAEFLGLSPYDWASVSVTAHSASPTGPDAHETLPIDPEVAERARAFFAKHGTHFWDMVSERGFYGCIPRQPAD